MSASAAPRRVELLQVRAPNVPAFVLALETQGDRSIAPHLRAHGVWEPAETALCQRLMRPGMRVVDAGAHAGYYSVLFSHLVGASGGVIAFEPEPANFRMLLANLLLNDCGNVEARPLALAQGRGAEFLHLCADNPGDHRLAPVPGRARIEVETIDLDSALAGAPLDFIKIDTQGAEPRTLAGMANTISVNRERLGCLMEFAPGLLQLAGVSLDQYAAQLAALDACVFAVSLRNHDLNLQRLVPLRAGLDMLVDLLAPLGEVDASCDVFAVFGAAAEAAWLARFQQGRVG